MNVRKFFKNKIVIFLLLLALFIYLNNSSLFASKQTGEPFLLAHRGMAQTFSMEGITNETCTAERIFEPEHPFIENTIASMEAAFNTGADIVEFDVHITKDDQFAVFHDWTLDCRTNGTGVTRDFTLEELKKLDIGYGYTADNGKTYPFRGKGVGLMPSLDEVLNHFPDKELLIHVKSNEPEEGKVLAVRLSSLPKQRLEQLTVYGGDEPVAAILEQLPELRVMSKATLKSCLLPYFAIGWTGYVPNACENTEVHIPEKVAPYLWGWPYKFVSRMDEKKVRTILVGGSGDFSSGFDSEKDLERLPKNYNGGISTNSIEKIARLIVNDK
jgi:glycerophosphoryl diester phosphodiesterase